LLEEAPSLAMAWVRMTKEEQAACLADRLALDLMVERALDRRPTPELASARS
jgi:hypothetical protein